MSATTVKGRQISGLGGDISGAGNTVSVDKIKGTPVSATAPTTGQSLVFNGTSWAPSNGAGGSASALATTGADVVVSGAAPPTTGQVLTATSATTANWQTPTGGGSNPYTGTGAFVLTNTWHMDSGTPNYQPQRSEVLVYDGTYLWMTEDNGVQSLLKTDLTGLVINRYLGFNNVSDVIFAFGYLWVANDSTSLMKVDPANGSIVATYVAGRPIGYLSFNATYIFTSSNSGDAVIYRFDPVTGTFNNRFDQPEASQPDSLVADGGANLWVIDQTSPIIRRVNRDPVFAAIGIFNMTFTAVADGAAGNSITIKFEFKGSGLPDVAVTGTDIVITVFNQTGQAREFQIVNAVNASVAASALIRAVTSSPNQVHNYNQAPYNTPQNFSGGANHQAGTIDVSASGLPFGGSYINGFLWVTMNNGDLLKIDPATDTVLATFPSGASALSGIMSDGSYFLHMTETAPGDKVRTFDFNSEYFVDTQPTGNNPDDVVWDFQNNIWAIDRTSPLVRRLSKKTGALLGTADITGFGLARRGWFGNSFLWLATSTGYILKIDPASDAIVSNYRTGQPLSAAGPANLSGGADAVAATKTIQDVLYTAVTAGNAGNLLTVAYTSGATAGSEVVTVTAEPQGTVVSMPMPQALNLASDGTDMWLAGHPSSTVMRVSPNGTLKRTYTGFYGGNTPTALAYDGVDMWAPLDGGACMSRLEPSGKITNFYIEQGGPRAIAYDGLVTPSSLTSGVPGGNMWIVFPSGSSLVKVSSVGLLTTFPYNGGTHQPMGIAFDGTNMWIANHASSSVTKVTPAGVMTNYTGTGANPWAIAFDGTDMWTANDDASVTKITSAGVMTTYTGLTGPATGIAFDGTNMWTSNPSTNSFSKIDSSGTITNYAGTVRGWKIAFDGSNFMWSQSDNSNDLSRIAVNAAGASTYINVQIEDNVSTAQDIVNAVSGFPAAAALVTPTTGAPANTQTIAGYSFFTGGVDALAAVLESGGNPWKLTFTAVTPGAAGNGITVEFTTGGTAGAEVVSVVATAIGVQIEDGVSKYQQVADAVNADVSSSALVLATTNSQTAAQLSGATQWNGTHMFFSDPVEKNVFQFDINSPQTVAQFHMANTPDDIAFDGGGNLWSADWTSNRIRRFQTDGLIFNGVSIAADGSLPRRLASNLTYGSLWLSATSGNLLRCDAYVQDGLIQESFAIDANFSGISSDGSPNFFLSATGGTDRFARFFYDNGGVVSSFYHHIIQPTDLQNHADRIKMSGPWFWTIEIGTADVRKVSPQDGTMLDTVSTAVYGSPLDLNMSMLVTTDNGKVLGLNTGFQQATASLTIQDLTSTSNSPGSSGNSFNIEYTAGNTLGQATVTFYDGTRLVVQIDSGVTIAQTVLDAILNTTGNGSFTTVISGSASNPQTAPVAQTFFTGGGNVSPSIYGFADSGKSAMGGITEEAGWSGPAVGYTAPTDGYLRMTGLGFFYTGTTIYTGIAPQRIAASATDIWVCADGPDAPFRVDATTMQVVSQITGAFGNNNGSQVVALLGGYVYMGDDNFPIVYKIDPATNSMIRRINVGDSSGGNNWAQVRGLFSDGTSLFCTSSVGSNFETSIMIERIVSDRTVCGIHSVEGDVSGNYQPMLKVGDALFNRMNYSLHRFNTNLG